MAFEPPEVRWHVPSAAADGEGRDEEGRQAPRSPLAAYPLGSQSFASRKTRSCETLGSGKSTQLRKHASPKLVALRGLQQQVRRHGTSNSTEPSYWIKTMKADFFFAGAIVVHSILLGFMVQVDLESHGNPGEIAPAPAVVFLVVRSVLMLVFSVELVLRTQAWGRDYLLSINGVFDVFLVLSSWIDLALELSGVALVEQVASAMHICRLLRLVRMFRLFAIVPALRLIVAGLMGTVVASLWAVCLLLLLAYAGSLLCTDVLHDQVPELFGSVPLSIFTHVKLALVEAWPDISAPMVEHSRLWCLYLAAFMLVSNMALLNVVTGLICEMVMDIAHHTSPPTAEENMAAHNEQRLAMQRLFAKADVNGDGTVSEAEYLELLKTFQMQGELRDFGVGLPLDHFHILSVLDVDNNGCLSHDEFVDGLARQCGTRSDHLSQTFQFDLSERTHQILESAAETENAAKAAVRRSLRRISRRLFRRIDAQMTRASTGQAKKSQARHSASELATSDSLLGLEEVSSALREQLQGLRAACLDAGRASCRAPAPVSVEDVPLAKWPDTKGSCQAGAIEKMRFSAGTGGIGGQSSGSGSSGVLGNPSSVSKSKADALSASGGSRRSSRTSSSSSRSSSSSESGSRSRSRSRGCSGSRGSRASGSSGRRSGRSGSKIRSLQGSPRFGRFASPMGVAGTLRVQVLGVHGLRNSGEPFFSGSFDTYIVLRLGALECRTGRACYRMGAAWSFGDAQVFDLQGLAASSPANQQPSLVAKVMNAWLVSDDILGAASVDLRQLEPGCWHRRRAKLDGRQSGELELALRFEPADEAEAAPEPLASNADGQSGACIGGVPSEDGAGATRCESGSRHSSPKAKAGLKSDGFQGRRMAIVACGQGEDAGVTSDSPSRAAFPGLEKAVELTDASSSQPSAGEKATVRRNALTEDPFGSNPLIAAARRARG